MKLTEAKDAKKLKYIFIECGIGDGSRSDELLMYNRAICKWLKMHNYQHENKLRAHYPVIAVVLNGK